MNALAYLDSASVTKKKRVIKLTPGELRGGVVKSPMLLTRTNLFVPIFLNFVFEVVTATGLLIFSTKTEEEFLRCVAFPDPDDLTRINFLVPIFLKRLFLQ
jgi:hypothetical protein